MSELSMRDGSSDFSGGVDSGRPTTIASATNPHGLKRDQLAWLVNGTVRGGGILTRTGFAPRVQNAPWSGIYQGGIIFVPPFSDPYMVLAIGGQIYTIDLGNYTIVNESAISGKSLPPTQPKYFFCQGEDYAQTPRLVIQAGDLITNPLFWDGTVLTQSNGFIAPGNLLNQIPPAGPMDFYMNRLWYAIGRNYIAGNIEGPGSSILSTTENPMALAGDALSVPSSAGNIRMLAHTAELDSATGEGRLLIGTPKAIYRCNVPITRDDWSDPNFANQQPLQTVAQLRWGPVSDRSAVVVNGDIFYQSLEPAIRSLNLALRYFQQWGNTPISRNENRALRFNDRALLRYSSGIEFNNRLLQTVLPYQSPVGVAHRGILPLDFDLISSLEEKLPPAWEGMLEGLDVLQLLEGDFGGLQRAFAVTVSRKTGQIEIWELTSADRFDAGDRRITTVIEFPSFDAGKPLQLKELETCRFWIDKLLGNVDFEAYYRPDQWPCWIFWHRWSQCTAKDCSQDPTVTQPCYPSQPYCETYEPEMTLPKPPVVCISKGRRTPSNWGYSFQVKLVIKGWCRVRGHFLSMLPKEDAAFSGLVCNVNSLLPSGPSGGTGSQVPPALSAWGDVGTQEVWGEGGTAWGE